MYIQINCNLCSCSNTVQFIVCRLNQQCQQGIYFPLTQKVVSDWHSGKLSRDIYRHQAEEKSQRLRRPIGNLQVQLTKEWNYIKRNVYIRLLNMCINALYMSPVPHKEWYSTNTLVLMETSHRKELEIKMGRTENIIPVIKKEISSWLILLLQVNFQNSFAVPFLSQALGKLDLSKKSTLSTLKHTINWKTL